ncbi:heterokaryon incompatibility protein-domain-containing protein [Sordaria brevicollis]|uniref:Heterokaryon incompatibility protein-domain-containing protein n=1 Tax=Sordaria brevicollis TaxID=83679 RepID=A0AAE0P364_SORBR|nr:heterokaryon incompatibility protein-domain-containing protein [Sordaria brevicollis]
MSDTKPLKDLLPRNRLVETDYVAGHILCESCSRIFDRGAIFKRLVDKDHHQEVFIHSQNLRQLLESSAAGCHLCTILCQDIELRGHFGGEEGQLGAGSGMVVAKCWGERLQPKTHVKVFWIKLRLLNQRGQAMVGAEGGRDRIEEILAGCDYDAVTCSQDIGQALISEMKDDDILFPRPETGSPRLLPTSTGSPEMMNVARSWLHYCIKYHPPCYPLRLAAASTETRNMKLPTRLIDVGEVSGCLRPRLVLPSTSTDLTKIEYVTLSHAWSVTVDKSHLKLSMENIGGLQSQIPMERLSQTFKDAMQVTQQLGYRYIWIDSLCIIQDSSEDWERESATMCDVYGNSTLTIAALGMDGLDACFRKRNPLLVTPCYLGQLQKGIYAYPTVHSDRIRLMDTLKKEGARLPSRGWFVQERLLSPRTLYLGAQELYWECATETCCESVPKFNGPMSVIGHSWLFQEKVRFHALCRLAPSRTPDELEEAYMKADLLYHWAVIQETYSASLLTYNTDRLVAFSGIVEAIQKGTAWTPVAGTWKELWPLDLLWFFHEPDFSQRVHNGFNTPSWSWFSVEGRKGFPPVRVATWENYRLAQVLDSKTAQTVHESKYDHHIGIAEEETTITLKGYTRRLVWVGGMLQDEQQAGQSGGGSVHYTWNNPDSPYVYWDVPPADGDAFLFLLIMSYQVPSIPVTTVYHYGLILFSVDCRGQDGERGTLHAHHEILQTPQFSK